MEKWKKLLAESQAAARKAHEMLTKAGDAGLSADQQGEFDTLVQEARDKKAAAEVAKKAADDAAEVAALAKSDGDAPDDDEDDEEDDNSDGEKAYRLAPRGARASIESIGSEYIKSDAYKSFRKSYPNGPGSGSPVNIGRVQVGKSGDYMRLRGQKALTYPQAQVQPRRYPTIDVVDRDRLQLLDLVSHGSTDGDFEYVQITGVTRNAKIVGELTSESPAGDLKPISDLQTQLADAKVYTYADGYEVTNKMLSNAPAFATYMNTELAYSIDSVIEEKLLSGSGTNGEPRGILNTTGVQNQEYVPGTAGGDGGLSPEGTLAFIRAARRAIGKITRVGGNVSGVAVSAELDEAIDLLQDENGRFYGQGPFGMGPGTLWGRPRVVVDRLVGDTGIVAEWSTVAFLEASALSVLVFNQHKDYAQRNLNYVRGEKDAAQVIWRPNRICTIRPATGG